MNRRRLLPGLFGAMLVLLFAAPATASAAPMFDVKASWGPTNLPPGGEGQFALQVRNTGDEVGAKKLFITDELPPGVTITNIAWRDALDTKDYTSLCSGVGTGTLSCVVPAASTPTVAPPAPLSASGSAVSPSPSGYLLPIFAEVAIEAGAAGTGTNTATVAGGGSGTSSSDTDQVPFDAAAAPFGIVPGSFATDVFKNAYPAEETSRQAGDHPFEQRVNFDLTAKSVVSPFDGTLENPANGSVRTVEVTLPRGLIGNPEALPKCDPLKFVELGATLNSTRCPTDSQVGYINILGLLGAGNHGNSLQPLMPGADALLARVPIYNLQPPKGSPVDLAFNAQNVVVGHIYATLDPAQNYTIKAVSPNLSTLVNVKGAQVTLWGVPGDPAHDKLRYFSVANAENPGHLGLGAPFTGPILPFFANPSDCGFENGGGRIRIDSYEHPGEFTPTQEYPDPLNVSGCDDPRFRFEPEVALQPTDRHAGAPTGLDVHLKVPQRDEQVGEAKDLYAEEGLVKGISTPPMKRAVVTFPPGMTLNPSAAQGLATCSAAQIGLGTDSPVTCPDASQYGTLTLHTPILPSDAQPEGFIYIAKQNENPYHNFLSFYMVIQESQRGILVKIPFKAELDPETGRISGSFEDLPQFPVSDLQMNLNSGVRAGLVEPTTCGTKTISAEFFSWQDPNTPHTVKSSYEVTQKPDGSPCVNSLGDRHFAPALEAGTENNLAGSYSPLLTRLQRSDDDQEFSQLRLALPEGLLGKLAGVAECSDAGIAQAEARTGAGEGALEQSQPSCPAGSQIGTTEVGAGVGVPLTYVPGKVYLAGPYKGAPFSVVVITPAIVGPYDLGVIVVRTALAVDPVTSRATAISDPFPQIYQGIPVRIRDIRINLDRREFILNPTSCAEKQIEAHLTGTGADPFSAADDSAAELLQRFQAAECASLEFKPRIEFKLSGGTHRGEDPAFYSRLTARPGDANIGRAIVALPKTEFLDNAHIGTVCTRVQYAAQQCPAGSIYGHARAITPLLDQPVEGPLILRSNPQRELPDLVAMLRGRISADLVGHVDSLNGGIRTSFETVPDVPVTEFILTMKGGQKGLLENAPPAGTASLCESKSRVAVHFAAQSGKLESLRPLLAPTSCKRHKRHHRPRG